MITKGLLKAERSRPYSKAVTDTPEVVRLLNFLAAAVLKYTSCIPDLLASYLYVFCKKKVEFFKLKYPDIGAK